MKRITLVLIIFYLCSCRIYTTTQKGNLTFGVVKSKIQKGQTTQSEILQIFGSPNLITKNKSSNEVWSYNKMSVEKKEIVHGGYTSSSYGLKASAASSQSFDLIIIFDEKDVVKDYSVVSTSY